MNNVVITIGREFGSGGKYIGKEVARRLGIKFYDEEIVAIAYEKYGANYSKLKEYDEIKKNTILKTLDFMSLKSYEELFEDDKYQSLICKTVKEIAEESSCVIIGRNSNNILREKKNVINLFIYSNNQEFKIRRKMEVENLTYEEASKKIKKVDKQRKKFYEYLNQNSRWGSKKEYDFCIDSSILGIEKTIELIIDIYNKKSKCKL